MPLSLFYRYMPLLAICICLLACNKGTDPHTTIIQVTNISDSGSFVTGSPVLFKGIASGATAYSWSFGDGTTSTEATPNHVYSDSGNYSVSLTINNNSLFSTQTSLWVGRAPVFASSISGTRTWRHYRGIIPVGASRDTTLKENVSATVNYIDNNHLVFGTDTLFLQPVRPPRFDTLASFYRLILFGSNHQLQMALAYHHVAQETITFSKIERLSTGASNFDYYFYP